MPHPRSCNPWRSRNEKRVLLRRRPPTGFRSAAKSGRLVLAARRHSLRGPGTDHRRGLLAARRQRFHQFRRRRLCRRERVRQPGSERQQRHLGHDGHGPGELAPAHLALPYARLPVLRPQADGPPSCEPGPARHQQHAPVLRSAADDAGGLAQHRGGRVFCRASLARRVGGLGRRTQGRAQHDVRPAGPCRLAQLPGPAQPHPLRGRHDSVHGQPDVEADACDAAVSALALGLLAAGEEGQGAGSREQGGEGMHKWPSSFHRPARCGKTAVAGDVRGELLS